jgi:hypothetical protein
MKTIDVLGSGAALPAALFSASNSSITATQADGAAASQPQFIAKNQDTVELSNLASALKDDGLLLFNSLSPDDRMHLASLVSAGKLTADELNDALSGLLKSARKAVFWEEAGRYQATLPTDVLAAQQDLLDGVARNAKWADKLEQTEWVPSRTGDLDGADAEALRARFEGFSRIDADGRRLANKLTPYLMSGTYATTNSPSDDEIAAAQKLRASGPLSTSFEAARRSLALDAVNKLVEETKSWMSDWL